MAKSKAVAALPVDEKRWQAEEDVEALARADSIKSDKKRMAAAKTMAKTLAPQITARAEIQMAKAKAMRKLAKKK